MRPSPAGPTTAGPRAVRLAVYVGLNLEHFAFGAGLGAGLGPRNPEPDVLNYAWRDYGNRVGAWRCLELFEQLRLRATVLLNTSLYDYCPELVDAFVKRGDELVGHGHTNSERQGEMSEKAERALLEYCRDRIRKESGLAVSGWLSPWISESFSTPDLLHETGYSYSLNWCHDDQPIEMKTRGGKITAIPYPQELNDIPAIIHRQMDARDFADLIIDNFDEMMEQSRAQPLVMGIALHPYIVGQPFRLRHLRRALQHILAERRVWFTTPGAICKWVSSNTGPDTSFFG